MVEDGKTGLLVESDNHIQLASKMLYALSNQTQSLGMIIAGHNELAKYKWENIKYKIYLLYCQQIE